MQAGVTAVKPSVREEDRLVAQPAAAAARQFAGLPARAQPARVERVCSDVK